MISAQRLPQRWLFAAGAAACAAGIGAALFFQHVMGLEPCPLCIIQRVALMALGAILLVAAVHDPGTLGRRVYGALVVVASGAGAGVAGRHVWLQSLPPDQVPECGPGLEYMLQAFPLRETLDMVLRGSGECAEVKWRLLGLSIPGWTLVMFSVFALAGLWLLATRSPRDSTARVI